jgi:single-strand DNA-binding protein
VSVNKVILIGNLGADPDVKQQSASGTAVCRFSLATNEIFKGKNGEQQKRTEWHSVVCFGKTADILGERLSRGAAVYVEGSIRSNKYEDREGVTRKAYDIVARRVQMLSPTTNGNGAKAKNPPPAAKAAQAEEDDNPFREDESAAEDAPF